jgi:hypothetical protein
MKFIRATRHTNRAAVFINIEAITAFEEQSTESERYTAIILHNGREIDVSETVEALLQPSSSHVVEL